MNLLVVFPSLLEHARLLHGSRMPHTTTRLRAVVQALIAL